jgi:hypothetical protein
VAKFATGQIPWNKGIACSVETKAKISAKVTGNKHTPEMQARLNLNLIKGQATRFTKGMAPHNKGIKCPRFSAEELKAHQKEWRVKNKEYINLNTKKWREANVEKTKLHVKKSRLNNLGRVYAANSKYRADRLQRTPIWVDSEELWAIKEAYALAALRTKMFGFSWHVDHIIPMQGKKISGLHTITNLQVITGKENLMKNNKFEGELS